MNTLSDFRSRKDLEEYLQDLICTVESPAEVGLLVETLAELQLRNSILADGKARAASASVK